MGKMRDGFDQLFASSNGSRGVGDDRLHVSFYLGICWLLVVWLDGRFKGIAKKRRGNEMRDGKEEEKEHERQIRTHKITTTTKREQR